MTPIPLNARRNVALFAVVLVLATGGPALAADVSENKLFGAGIILGEPTGGTLKFFIGDAFAIQTHLAVTFWDADHMAAFVDFIFYPSEVTHNRHFLLAWYFGVGGGFGVHAPWHKTHGDWEADPNVWVRVPFGFSFFFEKVPVEAFIEFGPSSRLVPKFNVRGFLAVGGRWYF